PRSGKDRHRFKRRPSPYGPRPVREILQAATILAGRGIASGRVWIAGMELGSHSERTLYSESRLLCDQRDPCAGPAGSRRSDRGRTDRREFHVRRFGCRQKSLHRVFVRGSERKCKSIPPRGPSAYSRDGNGPWWLGRAGEPDVYAAPDPGHAWNLYNDLRPALERSFGIRIAGDLYEILRDEAIRSISRGPHPRNSPHDRNEFYRFVRTALAGAPSGHDHFYAR